MLLPGGSPGVPDQGILHSLPKEPSKNLPQLQYTLFESSTVEILWRGLNAT